MSGSVMRKDGLIATDVTWGHKGRREIRAKKNNTHTLKKKKNTMAVHQLASIIS